MMSSSTEIRSRVGLRDFQKRLALSAFSLSLALHLAAALAVVAAGTLGSGAGREESFSVQEVALGPSPAGPKAAPAAPPARTSAPAAPPAMTSPSAAPPDATPAPPPAPAPAAEQEAVQDQAPGPAQDTAAAATPQQSGEAGSSLGLGMSRGFFTALGDGATLRDDIREYYLQMVEKINRQWWERSGQLKEPLRRDGVFELVIQRDGTLLSARMLQGSGSAEADRLLAEVIAQASPLPPLPATYRLGYFLAPLRLKAPLFLFRFQS